MTSPDTSPATEDHPFGPFGEMAAATLEHINDEHDDTVLFLSKTLCAVVDATSATLTLVDHDGLHTRLVSGEGTVVERRMDFPQRADTAEDAQLQFYALLTEARRRAGDSELTSLERELAGVGRIPTFVTTVREVVDLNPRLRQITVGGGLDRFQPLAPDQFVYVLAPPHGRSQLTIDESFGWEAYDAMPESERPVGAYYTVRRFDPEAATIDLWVVMHGHDGDGERWARNAKAGDPVALWGPRQAYEPPAGTCSFLLIGDETALPAIVAIAEQFPAGVTATVLLAVDPDAVRIELDSAATLDVHWLTVEHGDSASVLLDAVRGLGDTALHAATYVWGGAESHDITVLRRHVRDVVGVPRERVSLTGYWRRGGNAHSSE